MAIVRKEEIVSQQSHNIELSRDAKNVLEILDSLEDFTISIRKKIVDEIRSAGKLIHVKLDSI